MLKWFARLALAKKAWDWYTRRKARKDAAKTEYNGYWD